MYYQSFKRLRFEYMIVTDCVIDLELIYYPSMVLSITSDFGLFYALANVLMLMIFRFANMLQKIDTIGTAFWLLKKK